MDDFRLKPIIRGHLYIRNDGLFFKKDNNVEGRWFKTYGSTDRNGYYYTSYRKKRYFAHQEVAKAFLGPGEGDVHHKNENKQDNRSENLEWLSRFDHNSHHKRGEGNPNVKLTREQAHQIYLLKGTSAKKVAELFKVSEPTVYNIWAGRQWKMLHES